MYTSSMKTVQQNGGFTLFNSNLLSNDENLTEYENNFFSNLLYEFIIWLLYLITNAFLYWLWIQIQKNKGITYKTVLLFNPFANELQMGQFCVNILLRNLDISMIYYLFCPFDNHHCNSLYIFKNLF